MTDMALYARADGLFEPRAKKSIDFVKSNAGKMVVVDISHNVRTALQNRYLNGWVYTHQICRKLNEAGILNPVGAIWTRDVIHALMQEMFLVKFEFLSAGKHIKVFESTADMSRKRLCNYIDDEIKPFASSMWEIEIEDPRDGYWQELYNEIMRSGRA